MASRCTIFDEVLTYISEPIFQVPVNSFMDEHCLIFDIDVNPVKEHYQVFESYKKMVDKLLEAFCTDANVTQDEVIKGISKLNRIPDLHDLFYMYFEQVLSATDFKLFYPLMAKRNILIQEQVLAMILAATGILPDSLTRGPCKFKSESKQKMKSQDDESEQTSSSCKVVNDASLQNNDKLEMEVMQDVFRHVAVDLSMTCEFENELQRSVNISIRKSQAKQDQNCEGYVDSQSIEAVEREVKTLAMERKKLEERMKKMFLNSRAEGEDDESPSSQPEATKQSKTLSTEKENTSDISKLNILTNATNLSQEEIKNRQEFLRQQRDKLLMMKKEAREKQLKTNDEDEKSPSRPVSSRTARLLMKQNIQEDKEINLAKKEEDKKLALRRALAEKLRQEVIRKI